MALAQEYVIDNMQRLNVSDCTYLSENVIEPVYQLMMLYIRSLCLEYENLEKQDKPAAVPEFNKFFGENVSRPNAVCRPERCVHVGGCVCRYVCLCGLERHRGT